MKTAMLILLLAMIGCKPKPRPHPQMEEKYIKVSYLYTNGAIKLIDIHVPVKHWYKWDTNFWMAFTNTCFYQDYKNELKK